MFFCKNFNLHITWTYNGVCCLQNSSLYSVYNSVLIFTCIWIFVYTEHHDHEVYTCILTTFLRNRFNDLVAKKLRPPAACVATLSVCVSGQISKFKNMKKHSRLLSLCGHLGEVVFLLKIKPSIRKTFSMPALLVLRWRVRRYSDSGKRLPRKGLKYSSWFLMVYTILCVDKQENKT